MCGGKRLLYDSSTGDAEKRIAELEAGESKAALEAATKGSSIPGLKRALNDASKYTYITAGGRVVPSAHRHASLNTP